MIYIVYVNVGDALHTYVVKSARNSADAVAQVRFLDVMLVDNADRVRAYPIAQSVEKV